uniref:Uncharacterized protein n=1 Tax=Mycena chlorophos TaxID=658473 RepID=A0ABQ0LMS4_MYCCL|nr:predicted protein [Mycena chlorophos]
MGGGRASISTPSSTILRNGTLLDPIDTSSFPVPTESTWTTSPEHEGPPFTAFSETASYATGSESVAFSEPTTYAFPASSSSHSNRGEVVAAAVGGSLGALIAVSLGLCFLWATRRRRQSHQASSQIGGGGWGPTRAWIPISSHAASASTENLSPSPFPLHSPQNSPPSSVEQRFAALESELASLRAEVVRLRSTPGGEREMEQGFVSRGPSLIYAHTHTKADEAYRDPSRTRPGSGASVETEKTGPPLYVD